MKEHTDLKPIEIMKNQDKKIQIKLSNKFLLTKIIKNFWYGKPKNQNFNNGKKWKIENPKWAWVNLSQSNKIIICHKSPKEDNLHLNNVKNHQKSKDLDLQKETNRHKEKSQT